MRLCAFSHSPYGEREPDFGRSRLRILKAFIIGLHHAKREQRDRLG
jgi:hypothetical protein